MTMDFNNEKQFFQVRLHGRGGQGVVTGAELLSIAGFIEGKYTQSFPNFGSERMGAPVMAFCRIADKEIRLRSPILHPDAIIIQDCTLLHQQDILAGLNPNGYLLINSDLPLENLGLSEQAKALPAGHLICIPATQMAMEFIGRPKPNVPMLGALSAISGIIKPESICTALNEKFNAKIAAANALAVQAAYQQTIEQLKENKNYAQAN